MRGQFQAVTFRCLNRTHSSEITTKIGHIRFFIPSWQFLAELQLHFKVARRPSGQAAYPLPLTLEIIMATYTAEVIWLRGEQNFLDNKYSRRHLLRFDGGVEVQGSSSPHVVPVPFSATDAVDPEESFVASLSSCHMLWFLSLAANQGFVVDHYRDCAEGKMAKNPQGKLFVSQVTLHPEVQFSGDAIPSASEIEALHHQAHEECFIANSVKTEVCCVPVLP